MSRNRSSALRDTNRVPFDRRARTLFEPALGDQIDIGAEEVFEEYPEFHIPAEGSRPLEFHQNVNVTAFCGLIASHRPEQPQ